MPSLKSQKARIKSTTLDSPVLTTPALGTPASGVMTNMTGMVAAGITNDAITLAKMASGTDGNIISFDASEDPVAIATGSAGQVLTSTGAGSPPAMEALPAGGGLVHLLTADIPASTTTGSTFADFYDSDYKSYAVFIRDLEVDTDNVELRIQFNQTSDGTVESGANNESVKGYQSETPASWTMAVTGATYAKFTENMGNATGETFQAFFMIDNMQTTAGYTTCHGSQGWVHKSNYIITGAWAMYYSGNYTTSFQGITMFPGSGSFNGGSCSIFGYAES